MIKQSSVEYLAGLLDGEGSFTISKQKPSPKRANVSPCYFPAIDLINTHQKTLIELKASFGGHLYQRLPKPYDLGKKPIFTLAWRAKSAERLLPLVYPYLRIKQKHARIMLQFIFYRRAIRYRPHIVLSSADLEIRERYHQAVKALNR